MESKTKRICIFSARNLSKSVARSVNYEFENIICEIDDADIVTIDETKAFFTNTIKHSSYLLNKKNSIMRSLSYITSDKKELKKDYKLFIAFCMGLEDLIALKYLKGWEENCDKKICYINEIWVHGLEKRTGELKILSQFDFIFTNCFYSVERLNQLTKKPCFYLLPSVNTLRFCPYPKSPERTIDIYSLGRRQETVHQLLLKQSESNGLFYIYDTILSILTGNLEEHRALIINLIKRSKFFLVDVAKGNQPRHRFNQEEIPFRFFEGAAAGAVLIGNYPKTDIYNQTFNWPDAVIGIPDYPQITEYLEELDSQEKRIRDLRNNNIINMLKHHDCMYRWNTILDIIGEKPNEKAQQRTHEIQALLNQI